jgi:hypothetical protein
MAPPSQHSVSAAVRSCRSTVRVTSDSRARMSCLRSRDVVVGASKMARMPAPARVSQPVSPADSGLGWRAWSVASAAPARGDGCEPVVPCCLQRAGHQPVLRFAGVVLAAGAAGFVAGPFGGQIERPAAARPRRLACRTRRRSRRPAVCHPPRQPAEPGRAGMTHRQIHRHCGTVLPAPLRTPGRPRANTALRSGRRAGRRDPRARRTAAPGPPEPRAATRRPTRASSGPDARSATPLRRATRRA